MRPGARWPSANVRDTSEARSGLGIGVGKEAFMPSPEDTPGARPCICTIPSSQRPFAEDIICPSLQVMKQGPG